jgi:endoglucanase
MGGLAAYGSYPNLIYETFNEPELVDWSTTVKPYHQAVVAAIREVDPDNLIVLGSPEWCQRPDEAAADPVAGSNLAYALHFYACSHGQGIREQGEAALSGRLALFVTEWGATGYDGGLDGIVCEADAALWHDWMDARSISWTAWKFDDCTPDSTCILREDAPLDGGYTDEWLHGHGPFVRDRMLD